MIGKTGVFILLISFLHLVSSFPTSLGDNFKCKSRNGKFPKPGSFCRSYYLCANWNSKEKVCPQDQHFFPAKGYCVWADDYPCLEKPQSKECPLLDGKFLKPGTDCKVYYDCCKGRPTEKKCAQGTLFDHSRGKCDWPEYVTCPDNVSTTKSTSHSTSTLVITSTKGKVTKSTISPKIFTDSDEDSSSSEETSSEEGNSSEETKQSSTISETISTSVISSTRNKEYTQSTDGEVVISSTQPPSTVETSSTSVSSTEYPDDMSTISEISTASFTDEYVTKTATYTEVVTEETSTQILTTKAPPEVVTEETHTEVVTKETHPEVTYSEVVTKETPPEVTYSEIVTKETPPEVTYSEAVTKETPPEVTYSEVVTKEIPPEVTYSEVVTKEIHPEVTYSEVVTKETPPEVTYSEVVTKETHPEVTYSEFITKETPPEVTYSEFVTKETHPEVITEETRSEATHTIDGRDDFSKAFTPGLTDSVTTHIFCPKPNGYFPHPYDKHKFIACIGGNPTVMNCPEDLVYDHKRRSCEYNIKKRKINKPRKYL